MKRILILFFIIFTCTFSFAQSDSCNIDIPEICASAPLQSYIANTSGTAWAPFGTYYTCPVIGQLTMNPSFLFFEIGATGNFTMTIDPIDPFTGALLIAPSDLDYVCWGPFISADACTELQGQNQFSCSGSPAASETVTIPNAQAGEFYILLVSNYATTGTAPPSANIQFTASTSIAGANPLGGGGFAGADAQITACSSDLPFNLTDQLNGFPDDWGYWVDSISGNIVNSIFNPASDIGGTYMYIIPQGNSCGADTAWLEVNIFNASSISIPPIPSSCSNDEVITLVASPLGGVFSGTDVVGNIFTPSASNIGVNIISYEYTANGCTPITVTQNLTVNESPIVLPGDALTTNPSCFDDCDGTAIITATLGDPSYIYDWFGQNPLELCSGSYNYTVTDGNGCQFSDNVTIIDPPNELGVLTAYNSSCYGAEDGGIGITMNGGSTPPGTVSDPDPDGNGIPYCLSSTAIDFVSSGNPNQDATIEEVILIGDANTINNNTANVIDYYEDYTTTMYADITVGQPYTVDLILGDFSGGSYPSGAKVFIDYNIDGDFNDAGEEIGMLNSTGTSPNIGSINFIVPSTGAFGPTRMRVVSQDPWSNGGTTSISPCDYADPSITNDAPWFGATEDYSIVLNSPTIIASFLWDNGQTNSSIGSLGPGTYSVTITPISGCAAQDSAIILEPTEITFNPTIIPISCNTFTDGQILLNPSGGNGGGYISDWGANNPLALGDGSYSVTLSDPSTITTTNLIACENDTIITLIGPQEFNVDVTISSNEICLNDPITLDFNFNQGGLPDFTINYTENGSPQSAGPFISSGQHQVSISPTLIYPAINTYIITSITDNSGCIHQNTINSQSVNVNSLPDINITVSPNPICVGYSSILSFSTTSNGTPPYVVDYLNGGVAASESVPAAGSTVPVSPIITTDYELMYVTDSKGCESLLTDNTTLVVYEFPQLNTSYPTEFCEGESIEIDLDFTLGSPPFIIDYTFNGTPTSTIVNNQQSTLSFVSANPTNIIINTITANNCPNDINESIAITTNPLPIADISGNYELCEGSDEAEILVVITDGNPLYNIVYTNGTSIENITNASSNQTFTTNTSGVYSLVSVTDSKGCESISMNGFATVIINPLPNVAISAYPTHTQITEPLIYFKDKSSNHISGVWDFDDGQTQESNFNTINHVYSDTGTYQVSLTTISIDGCENTAYQTIIISPTFTIYIPNAFTPNNDLDNDYFMPILEGVQNFEMTIYDRQGQKIFVTNEYSNEYCITGCDASWDGTVNNGEYGTIGVYIYHLIITDINGKVRNFEGPISLIR